MTDDIKAAAERRQRVANGEAVADVYAGICELPDLIVLADAYLAEQPADDEPMLSERPEDVQAAIDGFEGEVPSGFMEIPDDTWRWGCTLARSLQHLETVYNDLFTRHDQLIDNENKLRWRVSDLGGENERLREENKLMREMSESLSKAIDAFGR